MGMRTDSEVASDVAQLNIVWLLRAYRREFSVFVDGKWLQYYLQNVTTVNIIGTACIRTYRADTYDT